MKFSFCLWLAVACLLPAAPDASAQFQPVFTIGADNASSNEFETASSSLANYYISNGDYTEAGLGGAVWTAGPEPAGDGTAGDPGFPRALTNQSNEVHIFFQLDTTAAGPHQPLRLIVDLINLRAGTTHDLEARLNDQPAFYSLTAINSARTLTILATTGTAGARPGSNKLTIRRTGGQLAGGSASIDFDHLRLEVDRGAFFIDSFIASDWIVRPGDSPSLSWSLLDHGASVSITPDIGNVDSQTAAGAGSLVLNPPPTTVTTYTLTATKDGRSQTRSVVVQVSNWDALFELGRDDASPAEFSHEAAADATYFFAGDYSTVGGPVLAVDEPLNDDTDTNTTAGQTGDPLAGYPRSLSAADPEINIWFLVSPAKGTPISQLQFSADVVTLTTGSNHAFQISMNDQLLRTVTSFTSASPRLIRFTATGAIADLHPGPNVVTIRRTGNTVGASVTFDYVMMEWLPGTTPNITSVTDDPILGTHTVTWESNPGATYRVQKSADGLQWDTLVLGFPTGGASGLSQFFEDRVTPPADPRPQYRIVPE